MDRLTIVYRSENVYRELTVIGKGIKADLCDGWATFFDDGGFEFKCRVSDLANYLICSHDG